MTPRPHYQSGTTVVYCVTCQKPLSLSCLLKDTHRTHQHITLREQLENLKDCFRRVELKVRGGEAEVQPQVSAAKQKLENTYLQTKQAIVRQYEELWTLLERNQQKAFHLLEAEKETLDRNLKQLDEDGGNFEQKLEEVQQLRKSLKKEKPEHLLENISPLDLNLKILESFYSSLQEKKFDGMRMKALEESVNKIVQMNKELLPRPWEFSETITFSERKKHKDLEIRNKGSEVSLRVLSTPMNHTTPWSSVVAVQSFSEGRHYWEVEVGGSGNWAVGVVEQGWKKDGLERPLGRDRKSWVLESDEGDLTALHGDDFCSVKHSGVQRLGVFVDCDKGRVKFYNVSTGCILHSFSTNCKRLLYPAFSLKTKTNSSVQLKICRITQDSAQYSQEDVQPRENSTGGGPDSSYVDSGESTVSVGSAEPRSSVASTEPGASVESTEPRASVESTEPGASVESTEPGASVESTEPGASVGSTEPGASVGSTEPGASIDSGVSVVF